MKKFELRLGSLQLIFKEKLLTVFWENLATGSPHITTDLHEWVISYMWL